MPISNSELAAQITSLVSVWRTRDVEFAAWLSGAADGGPYADGRYPLTDYLGTVQYLPCPAALVSGVSGSVAAAEAAQAAAETASGTAVDAGVAAEAARDSALAHKNAAAASAASALTYRNAAENFRAQALDYRNTAQALFTAPLVLTGQTIDDGKLVVTINGVDYGIALVAIP